LRSAPILVSMIPIEGFSSLAQQVPNGEQCPCGCMATITPSWSECVTVKKGEFQSWRMVALLKRRWVRNFMVCEMCSCEWATESQRKMNDRAYHETKDVWREEIA